MDHIINYKNYSNGADGDGDADAYTDAGLITDVAHLPNKQSHAPRFNS